MAKKATSGTDTTPVVTNYDNLPEGLRSIQLIVENFKKLRNTTIDIGGKSLMFVGPNESGKSTLIQAMMSPMNSKLLPSEPITKGEDHARISHTIGGILNGEPKTYIMDIYFTKKDSKGRLVIRNEHGEELKSPATLIKTIIGAVSFDVTQWLKDPSDKKLKTIKALTGRGQEIDQKTAEIKLEKESLKKIKDRADELDAILSNHGFSAEEVDKYSTKIDILPLQNAMSSVSQQQQQWNNVKAQADGFASTVATCSVTIGSANVEILRLQAEIERQKEIIAKANADSEIANSNITIANQWLNDNPAPSAEDLNKQINDAIAHNEKFNSIGQLQVHQRELLKCRENVEVKKGLISTLEDSRTDIISKSQLPIPGLSFDDETLYLDGLPLEEGQVNTARLWDVGVEVAMALNPNLKIIFLHDANVFDKKHLQAIIQKVEARGYMVVAEFVSFEGSDLEIVFTETAFK